MSLFRKAILFGDIHFGLKNNSVRHNDDCLEYIDWVISLAKKEKCETIFFLGDFFHNRSTINVQSLDYSLLALDKINNNFNQCFWLTGNHDLYYKDSRKTTSVRFIEKFKNIHLINDIITLDGVTFVHWLLSGEHTKVKNINSQYLMGHLELPHFFMNSTIQMPDLGNMSRDELAHYGEVYSGHFHKRQVYKNISYIGNAMPHNYADAWDDNRGCCVLEWGKTPEYYNWDRCPKYLTLTLSQLLDNPDMFLDDRTYAQVAIDVALSYEEASFIKETLLSTNRARELSLILPDNQEHEAGTVDPASFKSVDQMVHSGIDNIDSQHYDKYLLRQIYENL